MKYLENIELENLTKFLTGKELGGLVINGRCEVFSKKKAGDDKKEAKFLEQKYVENTCDVDCPPKTSTKLYVDLVQTLNASLTDYDFSELRPESFEPIPCSEVVKSINSRLAEVTAENPTFLAEMWHGIDTAIGGLNRCEAYELTADPFSEDMSNVWSFHYFIHNKELKRICYFNCVATTKCHSNGKRKDMFGFSGKVSDYDDADVDGDSDDEDARVAQRRRRELEDSDEDEDEDDMDV
jgi:hypothetical protein